VGQFAFCTPRLVAVESLRLTLECAVCSGPLLCESSHRLPQLYELGTRAGQQPYLCLQTQNNHPGHPSVVSLALLACFESCFSCALLLCLLRCLGQAVPSRNRN
jgi:hypothetical protein